MSQTQVERLFIADKTSTTGNMWRVTSSATLAAGSGDLTANWETIEPEVKSIKPKKRTVKDEIIDVEVDSDNK